MSMEEEFERACLNGTIPGAVLLAGSASGDWKYARVFGQRATKDGQPLPLELGSLMRIASASKLITSVIAMQCVERGLIGLDEDVTLRVPELRDIQLLVGYDAADKPMLRLPSEKITLRRLLSHSSGFCYDGLSTLLIKWRQQHGQQVQPSGPKLVDRFLHPLTSEPGTEWIYSPSIDWAGRVVERVTGASLEENLQKHVCQPLGISGMTFFPQKRPELLRDRTEMAIREPESGKWTYSDENYWHEDPEDCFGGMGIFSGPEDFFKVMSSLAMDDGRLLSSSSIKEFFKPQLSRSAVDSMAKFLEKKENNDLGMGGFFPHGSKRDHSLAGILLIDELPELGWRRAGSVAWMGLPNFYWVIDPQCGLHMLYASQLKPSDDEKSQRLVELFERTMYQRKAKFDGLSQSQ